MNLNLSRIKSVMVIAVLVLIPAQTIAAQQPNVGRSCKVLSQKILYTNFSFECVKKGKKLVWKKITKNFASSPAPAPTGTPTPTPSPTQVIQPSVITLEWVYKSEAPLIPGTLLDGDPAELQDFRLNSSFVVQAKKDGVPSENLEIVWTSSDSTSKVVPFSSKTDVNGLARSWYFSGKDDAQTVAVKVAGAEESKLETRLDKASVIKPTVGRYVATYISAPGYLSLDTKYESFTIQVTPKTSPMNTYYQLITTWQQKNRGDVSFYGGIQQTNCKVAQPNMASGICDESRGNQNGHLALFSAWNAKTPSGIVSPKIVHLGEKARCVDFTHEGAGLMCSQPLDWKVGTRVKWRVDILGVISDNFTRVRSSIALGNSETYFEVATLDLPDSPNLTTVAPFVEQWAGNEAASCLEVSERELEINSLIFHRNGVDYRPIYGQAMGGMYSDSMTRCINYRIESTSTGISIKSGGLNNWVDLRPVISRNSNNLSLKYGFFDLNQSLWFWQDLDLSSLQKP